MQELEDVSDSSESSENEYSDESNDEEKTYIFSDEEEAELEEDNGDEAYTLTYDCAMLVNSAGNKI